MKIKGKVRTLLILDGVLLAVILAAAILLTNYIYADGGIYPRNGQLNLRDREVAPGTVDILLRKNPDREILWYVPFQGERYSSDIQELTVSTLSDGDLELLKYFPSLRSLDGRSCPDYENLNAFRASRPGCQVLYNVPASGQSLPQDAAQISLRGLTEEDARALTCLPELSQVHITGCDDYAMLLRLQQEQPQWNLTYTAAIAGQELAMDTGSARLENAGLAELAATLPGLPQLQELALVNPDATAQELSALQEQYPNVSITWEARLLGVTYAPETTQIDISGSQVASTEEVAQALKCLPNLEKVIMSDCGIDNETMAAFREQQREHYKVVWTVYLSDKTKCRTDAAYFMPIEQGEYYFLDEDSYNLRYCEDLVCLDLGHHMIHNVDFLAFMPKLKYLILAHSGVRDISPIVHCQELIYLEVDWSEIQDYTPIAQLKKLEDLNLTQTFRDITPILEMTWLKNLWAPGRPSETQARIREALPNTNLSLGTKSGWRKLPNYYAMRDFLGKPYMGD